MAAAFDFDKYYSIEKVRTETSIDRSGVDLQNPTETSDIVTNNVVYYCATVSISYIDGRSEILDGSSDKRIIVVNNSDETVYYVRPWHRIGSLIDTGIDTEWMNLDGNRKDSYNAMPNAEYSYYVIDDSDSAGRQEIRNFVALVYPRYEAETSGITSIDNQISGGRPVNPVVQSPCVDAKMMKLLYGALGLYGGRWKGNKWLEKWVKRSTNKLGKPVMSYDTFRKRMAELSSVCAESDIGVKITYYDKSFSNPVTDDATASQIESADRTMTGMSRSTTFDAAYSVHLPMFLKNNADLLSDLRGNTATALIPPVKDVVRAFFYPIDEIGSEFEDLFIDTMKQLSNVPVLWKFVSDSKKTELDEVSKKYRDVTGDAESADRMGFDLEILLNSLDKYDASISTPTIADKYNTYPRLIQIGATAGTDKSHIVGQLDDNYEPVLMWWVNPDEAGGVYTSYDADDNIRATKKFNRLSAEDINRILVEYYNTAYASKRDYSCSVDYSAVEYLIAKNEAGVQLPANYRFGDDDEVPAQFVQFYTEVSKYMNMMRSWGGDHGEADDDHGINAGRILGTLFPGESGIYDDGNGNHSFSGARFPQTKWVLYGYYDVISWGECSIPDSINGEDEPFVAEYTLNWRDFSNNPDISVGYAVNTVDLMRDIYKDMRTAMTVSSLIIGPVLGALASTLLNDVEDSLDRLDELANQLLWYQRYVKESPFANCSMIPDDSFERNGGAALATWTIPGRLMFPVSMYQKVRVKYKNIFGRTRHRTVKKSIGVRWAEVIFFDTSVYAEYPQVTEEAGEDVVLGGNPVIIEDGKIVLDEPLSKDIVERKTGTLVLMDGLGNEYRFGVTIESDILIALDDPPALPGPYIPVRLRVQLAPSQPTMEKEPVEVIFNMPALPYDSEIRHKAFSDYGPFTHIMGFPIKRYSSEPEPDDIGAALEKETVEHHDGWKVFHESSDSIENFRDGLGIHDKVAMLLSILRKEFGESRVQLIESYRSMDDQARLCSGGPESYFLSWHNYGLAARILVLQNDGKTPIEKDSPEMKRMIPIARAFSECCRNGGIGEPCNVIWCARLTVGPSIFDWEFLPIGVNHKDAPRFRNSIMAQRDPVRDYGFVDVDSAGYVYQTPPEDGRPYVLSTTERYRNALIISGKHYMPPEHIRNYRVPDDIILYDIKEYINLMRLKMNANGSTLVPGKTNYDWKMMNDGSVRQLTMYYAMIGEIASAKAILAGDYVDKYGTIDNQLYSTDPVGYLQGMLGRHYYDIRITVPRDGASAYITLHDGIYHMVSRDAYPDNLPTRLDTHKQQQVDNDHIKWGSWHDGLFYTEDERKIPVIDSESPVISGYENGKPVSGEARYLHIVVANRVHELYVKIRDMFEGFSGALMYDRIEYGPNAGMMDMLENEFGLIEAQDLLTFDDLEQIVSGIDERIKVGGSIYEKVVNNAQMAGIRKAVLTKEHIHIKDTPTKSDAKTLYDLMRRGKGYMANDLLK